MSAPRVLIAGFEPFGGDERNPSGELALEMAAAHTLKARVQGHVLPVVFREASRRVQSLIKRIEPEIALLTGLAAGSSALALERVGVNYFDAGGHRDETIIQGAPDAYFSPFPVTRLVEALRSEGVPARASLSAGSYCCNEVLFAGLHTASSLGLKTRVGFVHLPYLPAQAEGRGVDSMPRALQRKGLELILARLLGGG